MQRLISLALLLSFGGCYLRWGSGDDTHGFLFQIQYHILFRSGHFLSSVTHPAILVPLVGEIALLVTLFQKKPALRLALAGALFLAVLVCFILFIGILSKDLRISLSALPFIACMIWLFVYRRHLRKQRVRNVA